MTRVMAVDGGESTGYIIWDFGDDYSEIEEFGQFKASVEDAANYLDNVRDEFSPDVLVVEQFDLRPGNDFVADLVTVEVNAILKYLWGADNIVWQTPGQAKGQAPNHILKRFGFWPTGKTVGQPDANDVRDAARHAVYYGVNVLKHRATILKGWPNAN